MCESDFTDQRRESIVVCVAEAVQKCLIGSLEKARQHASVLLCEDMCVYVLNTGLHDVLGLRLTFDKMTLPLD